MTYRHAVIGPSSALIAIVSAVAFVLRVIQDPTAAETWEPFGFGIFYALIWVACRRGHARATALAGTLVSNVALIGLTSWNGGADYATSVFLPLGSLMVWTWVGSGAALVSVGASIAVLAACGAPTGEPHTFGGMVAHATNLILGAGLIAVVMKDLRQAVERAWEQARIAERTAATAIRDDAARAQFLGLVSQQLRDPLDVVLGYAALLREEETDSERAEDLDRIANAGRQLADLIQDLLDMSRVEGEQLPVVCDPVPVQRVLRDVAEVVHPLFDGSTVILTVQDSPGLPLVTADEVRLRQVLTNLVVNAVKYTERGSVAIRSGAGPGTVWVEVEDTGIGIPAQRLDDVFQPFVQLQEGPDRRPGVGLGLALSKHLVQRMGGELPVRSRVGHGSTFTVTLPRSTHVSQAA